MSRDPTWYGHICLLYTYVSVYSLTVIIGHRCNIIRRTIRSSIKTGSDDALIHKLKFPKVILILQVMASRQVARVPVECLEQLAALSWTRMSNTIYVILIKWAPSMHWTQMWAVQWRYRNFYITRRKKRNRTQWQRIVQCAKTTYSEQATWKFS